MLLFLSWLGAAVIGPVVVGRYSMRLGVEAFSRKDFGGARKHLERAARYESLSEEAVTLMAEASIHAGNPGDALYVLNTMMREQEEVLRAGRSTRVRLLRGVAGCMLGRPMAARRELAAIPRIEASVDELLAAAQACVLAGDATGAQQLCEELEKEGISGAVAGRMKLCRAAVYFQREKWSEALEAMPGDGECTPEDRIFCGVMREELAKKVAG